MTVALAGPFQFSSTVVRDGLLQLTVKLTEAMTNFDLRLDSSAIQWEANHTPIEIESANGWTVISASASGQLTLSGYNLQALGPGQTLLSLKLPVSAAPTTGISLNLQGEYNDPAVPFKVNDVFLPTAYVGKVQMGTAAAETLTGGEGADTLLGGEGNDTLQGGLVHTKALGRVPSTPYLKEQGVLF